MKCPFRKLHKKTGSVIHEYYEECDGLECPFYSLEIKSKCYKVEATVRPVNLSTTDSRSEDMSNYIRETYI